MKKALVFYGGWPGHRPDAFAKIYTEMLQELGMDVDTRDTQEPLTDPELLASLDLLVPCWTMDTLEAGASKAIESAVRQGTGIAGAHGGMGDAFRNNTEYQFIVGGQFVAHQPQTWDYQVRITQPNDPLMAGIGDFSYHSEQYYMHTDPSNVVLAETTFSTKGQEWAPWIDGTAMPVVWKRHYGEGRVFYSSLGHAPEEYTDFPQAREILKRGFAWAAKL